MRYRKHDADGDYTFGNGENDFYRDVPEAVAQAVQTRLLLFTGEWFLDLAEGTPWRVEVLGKYTMETYDVVIKSRILDTPGVTRITDYTSNFDSNTRTLDIVVEIDTVYGATTVTGTL